MREGGYVYPPPKRAKEFIVACVVEKKGDETGTSMRQNEIYAYSINIIIGDGYMVMPKIHWKDYNPGEWFWCKPSYAVDRYGEVQGERELTELRKIDWKDYKRLRIPVTQFENEIVKIECPFVLCPDFIRGKGNGAYKKLIIMNIGQGFVRCHNTFCKSIVKNKVYCGVFEFRAKDNGAVNFDHASRIRDKTNHVIERDAMWELVKVFKGNVSPEWQKEMQQALLKLYQDAAIFDNELKNLGVWPESMRQRNLKNKSLKAALKMSNLLKTNSLWFLNGISTSPTRTLSGHNQMPIENRPTFRKSAPHRTFINELSPHVFHSIKEYEDHRSNVIVARPFQDASNTFTKIWIDLETGDTSLDNDILYFKFAKRYLVSESFDTTESPRHDRSISENSFRIESIKDPQFASTPRGSPQLPRRITTITDAFSANITARSLSISIRNNDTFTLLKNNNANPMSRNNFIGYHAC